MRLRRDDPIEVKSPAQLAIMREAGLVTAAALHAAAAAAEPGISTAELDAIAEREIRSAGALPSFQGYHGYPATICTSVNDQIVHGIPDAAQVLSAGDIISIDCGAIVGGWHGDSALTVRVGQVQAGATPYSQEELDALLGACERALWHGLAQAVPGRRLTDISHAVEQAARAAGRYGIVREYTGHGIGSKMHMDPAVPNYGRAGRGPVLTAGMALAIEPMLVLGGHQTRQLDDGWTVVTADGSWAAHFEHTVAITNDGPFVLTAEDGGASGLAALRADRPAVLAEQRGRAGQGVLARQDVLTAVAHARCRGRPRWHMTPISGHRTPTGTVPRPCCGSTWPLDGWRPRSSANGWTGRSRLRRSARSTRCSRTCPASTSTGCPMLR
jgi:methionyl aminopeptidase